MGWIALFFKKLLIFGGAGLCCCAQAFCSWGEQGYSLVAFAGFLLRSLLLLQSMGSRACGLRSCGSWALEHRLSSCGTGA